ncbi:MAG: D-glycero-beta-D-manno-heptose 1,7-bisphosphate 7-phosphatase [Thermomonas sp.]|nr:D-glycero-beta-D-manno-heptose 1,7-bisphosphate 7-phosphatase [Thermomonas sp.]
MPADEAIVLAGGFGTRLRGIVDDVPKPLAPVAGRPFLAWLLDRLADSGIRRCILATGYMSDAIERTIGTRWQGMEIAYSVEPEPLGTGGAIRLAVMQLLGTSVHVLNGDTWLVYPPQALERATRESGALIGMALAEVADVGRYGAVERDGRGMVAGFREKGEHGRGAINAGCYFLTEAALAALPAQAAFSFEREVLQPAAASGGVAGFLDTSGFIDIGVPEDYQVAQGLFAAPDAHPVIRAPYIDPDAQALLASMPGPRRALFLDRDGVINVNHGYVHTPAHTEWVAGIFDRVREARAAGYLPIVVTNQAGIGRGYYDEPAFLAYSAWMHERFAEQGAPLLATYWCPHHAEAGLGDYRVDCTCRKPAPGMLLAAATAFDLDLPGSFLVGDKVSDLEAGRAAGLTRVQLVADDGSWSLP